MPIYDQGYIRYEARGPLRQARFWPITREALRLVLVKRWFLALLTAGFIPFVVRVVQIYVVTQYPQADRVLPIDGRLFGEFLNQQIGFTILLSIFGASGLVANDLRTGAILAYLSRPLTRRDYVVGKLLVPLFLNLAVKVWEWAVTYFVVTSQRFVLATGVITRKVNMMPLAKVTDMTFQRSPMGRLLGFGEFILESAGQDQALTNVDYLPYPEQLYLEVCGLIFKDKDESPD